MGLTNNLGKLSNTITSNGSAAALGVTPSAWSGFNALQVSSLGLWSTTANNSHFSSNLYYDGTDRRYITSDYALEYNQQSGIHKWLYATSGTAGAVATLTEAMRINSVGQVSIGTTSAVGALTIKELGLSSAPLVRYIGNSGNGEYMRTSWFSSTSSELAFLNVDGTNAMNFGTNVSMPLTLFTNGTTRIQIPATSTSATLGNGGTLKVIGNGTTNGYTELQFYTYNAPTNKPPVSLGIIKTDNGGYENGEFYIATKASNADVAPTERMRISSNGGLTSTADAGGANSQIFINSSTSNPYGPWFRFNADPNNSVNYYWVASAIVSGSEYVRGQLLSNGGLRNYQANNVNLSDERTKKDIIPLESYWDKFKAIEMVKFKYKDQTHNDFNIGVIAQQLEEIAPEFVDIDGWGETPEDGIPLKSVYTADLHHATIKVLQEAMAKIEELEAKVTALENKS